MKNTMKKLTAGVSALAMAATLSATSVPAFAAEFESMESQEFVNSFENPDTRTVAQFYLDNGLSLDELEDIMTTYEEGLIILEQNQSTSASTRSAGSTVTLTGDYYNNIRKANSSHYAVITNDYTDAYVSANILVSMSSSVSCYSTNVTFKGNYGDDLSSAVSSNKKNVSISGFVNPSSKTISEAMATFQLDIGSAPSEASVYSSLSCTVNYNSLNGKDAKFSLNTYALGDIDHNGIVNSADSTLASQFLVHLVTSIQFDYSDVGDDIASQIFTLAFDVNMDGKIDITDSVEINKLVE